MSGCGLDIRDWVKKTNNNRPTYSTLFVFFPSARLNTHNYKTKIKHRKEKEEEEEEEEEVNNGSTLFTIEWPQEGGGMEQQ